MKNIAQILIGSILFVCCTKEQKVMSEPVIQKKIVDVKALKHFQVGLEEKFEALPLLDFTEIAKNEYENLRSTAHPITNSPLQSKNGNYIVELNDKILQLKKLTSTIKEGETQYDYLGFYPSLDMYAFSANSIGDNLGFSEFNLINATNSSVYSIVSPGDDKVENPVISPDTKYLAYAYNYMYDKNKSFLGILKINNNQTFTEYRSFSSDNFNIKEVVWFGDDYIGIKVTDDDSKTFKYYKANLLLSNTNKSSNLSGIDGNYSIHVETEATSTGMASISYSFKIKGNEAILETNTYHEPVRCNGKYLVRENDNIFELYYNDTENSCKSDSGVFFIKKEGDKYFIKGIGSEATVQEWLELNKD
ncbi:hypothetical protein [Chryseobacterium cheonjiense]|uniref:Uncharacterized protein n=1 Tax=Chryseobacterium cheonjiense TaxID=2728845 RepID=A0A7Y0A5Q7_9FLAO|nr:hypothetical protein [Chryseobacterium cheonjiense]NML57080.1 hypothetical protein [Chryseobacterium cheonjiense]